MDEKKLQELINRDIDSDLTEKEQEKLLKAMIHDASIKKQHGELEQLSILLKPSEMVDPPKNLKKNIMNSVSQKQRMTEQNTNMIQAAIAFFKSLDHQKKILPFAYGLVLGAALIFIVLLNKEGLSPDNSLMTGTLKLNEYILNIETTIQLKLTESGLNGTIDFKKEDNIIYCVVSASSTDVYHLNIKFDPEKLKMQNITPNDGRLPSVVLTEDQIETQLSGGNDFILTFELQNSTPASLLVQLYNEANLLLEETIKL